MKLGKKRAGHGYSLLFVILLFVLSLSAWTVAAFAEEDEEETDWEEFFFHAYDGEGEERSRCFIVRRGEEALAFTGVWEDADLEDCYAASSYDADTWYRLEYIETVNEEMYCWSVPDFDDWDAVLEAASPRMGEECLAIYAYPEGDGYAYDYDLVYIEEIEKLFDDGTAVLGLSDSVSGMGEVPAILFNENADCMGILFEEDLLYVEWFDEEVFNAGNEEEEAEAEAETPEEETEAESRAERPSSRAAAGEDGGSGSGREERQQESTRAARESSTAESMAESRATDILDETEEAVQEEGGSFPLLAAVLCGVFAIAILGGILAFVLMGRKKKQGQGYAGDWNAGSPVYVPQQGSPDGMSPWLSPQGGGSYPPKGGGNAQAFGQNQWMNMRSGAAGAGAPSPWPGNQGANPQAMNPQGVPPQPAWPGNPGGYAPQKAAGYATPTLDPAIEARQGMPQGAVPDFSHQAQPQDGSAASAGTQAQGGQEIAVFPKTVPTAPGMPGRQALSEPPKTVMLEEGEPEEQA